MDDFTAIAKALADPGRARVLLALSGRELCVCQIVELLGLAPSTVSKHMTLLAQAGLVEQRKEGRWAYYRRRRTGLSADARRALRWLDGSLGASAAARADTARLRAILRVPTGEFCRLREGAR